MPRNGSGVYSLPAGYAAVANTTATASQHNTPLEDIASVLNTALPVSVGGTGATSAPAARTNLGVAIGSDVQAYNATLTSIAALGTAGQKFLYTNGVNSWVEGTITLAGRQLLDDANAEAQRTTLGLGTAALMADSADTNLANDPDAAARRDIVKAALDDITQLATKTAVSASGTSVTLTGIPSTAKYITVEFAGLSASGSDDFLVQIGDSGGYETASYTSASADATAARTSTSGFVLFASGASGSSSGHMTLTNISGNTWVSSHSIHRFFSGAGNSGTGGGVKSLSGTLDKVRVVLTGSNTFSAGSVNIKYQ